MNVASALQVAGKCVYMGYLEDEMKHDHPEYKPLYQRMKKELQSDKKEDIFFAKAYIENQLDVHKLMLSEKETNGYQNAICILQEMYTRFDIPEKVNVKTRIYGR